MPEKGAAARADMLSWLAKEAHSRLIHPDLGQMIAQLEGEADLDEDQQA
jgi:Zn-dependent M32 family carboxypeptidase